MTDYKQHAKYWRWDEFDNSEEYEFWASLAAKYGKNVLNAMCAVGESGAYLAHKGFRVTALDFETEMIAEGKRLYGAIPNLSYMQGDLRDLKLDSKVDFTYIASMDIHLLDSGDVTKALRCINRNTKVGGGLALEVWIAPHESFSSPQRIFHPRVPPTSGVYVWKESKSEYDAITKVQSIHQIVHVEAPEKTVFPHEVRLQLYDFNEMIDFARESGFALCRCYSSEKVETADESQVTYVEFVKTLDIEDI
ncbi:MAG: class I SAM-dependent methyltransferase [Clostridia bacterium]|nr:class I SAM-dependent methyltransferase [Clostridia bacterium]